jgi:hypothetical protein
MMELRKATYGGRMGASCADVVTWSNVLFIFNYKFN